jgi:hypothetical protein
LNELLVSWPAVYSFHTNGLFFDLKNPPHYSTQDGYLQVGYAYVLNNPFDFASNPVTIEIMD